MKNTLFYHENGMTFILKSVTIPGLIKCYTTHEGEQELRKIEENYSADTIEQLYGALILFFFNHKVINITFLFDNGPKPPTSGPGFKRDSNKSLLIAQAKKLVKLFEQYNNKFSCYLLVLNEKHLKLFNNNDFEQNTACFQFYNKDNTEDIQKCISILQTNNNSLFIFHNLNSLIGNQENKYISDDTRTKIPFNHKIEHTIELKGRIYLFEYLSSICVQLEVTGSSPFNSSKLMLEEVADSSPFPYPIGKHFVPDTPRFI
jgi:hypothetical protein